MLKRIVSIIGARPNIIKLAPVYKAIKTISDIDINHMIIHTGQHYDYSLSEIFFKEFKLSPPDIHLEVGSGSSNYQIGEMIKRLDNSLEGDKINLVIVYGDTNSTLAGALSAVKNGIDVVHVESGLRSFDREMPEEVNRVIVDHISKYLFTSTDSAKNNLLKEGINKNIIIESGDLSVEILKDMKRIPVINSILEQLHLASKSYYLFTLHRSGNTDSYESLLSIYQILSHIPSRVVFPIHPRTKKSFEQFGLYKNLTSLKNVLLISPVGYFDFIVLLNNSIKVITDSGGVQKEAYLSSIPCVTLRNNTEWIETVEQDWNILVGISLEKALEGIIEWVPSKKVEDRDNIFGNGNTSDIIKNTIYNILKAS